MGQVKSLDWIPSVVCILAALSMRVSLEQCICGYYETFTRVMLC